MTGRHAIGPRHAETRWRQARRLLRAVFSVHGLTLHQHIEQVGETR